MAFFLANQMLVLFFPIFISNLVRYYNFGPNIYENINFGPKGLTKILRPLLYTNWQLECIYKHCFSVAQSSQKLEKKLYQNEKNVSDTCRTRDRHVSRVWDHDHWIPGKILTCLHVNYFPVAHLERELGFKPTKKKEGGPKKKLRGFEKN